MAKFNHISNNFRTGEFGPRMRSRTDLEEYRTSVEQIENCFVSKQGSADKRMGSEYVKTLPLTQNIVRTIPFIFSKTEAYIITLETSQVPVAPASVLNSPNFLQDPAELSRYHSVPASSFVSVVRNNGAESQVDGDLGNIYVAPELGANTVEGFGLHYYLPFPREIFNIPNLDVRGFHFAQSADILVLTHSSGDIPPLIIARTGEDSFTVEWLYRFNLRSYYGTALTRNYYSGVLRTPLLDPNISDTTIRGTYLETHRIVNEIPIGGTQPISQTEGDVNLYDVFTLEANRNFFTDSDLGGTYLVSALDINTGELPDLDFQIIEIINPREVRAITSRLSSGVNSVGEFNTDSGAFDFPATDNWSRQAWGSGRGFPRSVCFFEQRLILGGSPFNVDTIWGSRTGNIFEFLDRRFSQDQGTDVTGLGTFVPTNIPDESQVVDLFGSVKLETDPISFKPSSQEINSIQWLSSGQSLMVGTLGAEYVVSGENSALSSTSITFRRQTSRGSSPIMPVRIDDEVMYIHRDGRSAYNFRFNRNNGSFISADVTLHADHIVDVGEATTVAQYVQTEYCTSRDLVLAVTDDNFLIGFTYSPQHNTTAWHRFRFDAEILSVASIPSFAGDVDEIWICARRNGVTTLEKVGMDFRGEIINDPSNPSLFLDSHISRVNLQAPETVSMPWLIGKTVNVYKDGFFHSTKDLTAGDFDVELPISTTVIVGLPFEAFLITNDLNAGGTFGSPVGNIQRLDRITGIFYKSINVNAGHPRGQKIDPIKNMNSLTTGNRNLDFPFGSSEDGAQVIIISRDAFPMSLLGIVSRGLTSDR